MGVHKFETFVAKPIIDSEDSYDLCVWILRI